MEGKKLGNRHCCYGQCNSDERYPHRCEDVSFIPFPKPKTRLEDCKAWIKMCGRPHDQLNPSLITKNYFVCSKHFVKGKPTTEFPYPVPYDGRPVQRGRKRRNEATPESYTTSKKGRSCTAQSLQPDSQSVQPESEVPAAASVTDISGTPLDILSSAAEMRSLQEENVLLKNRLQHLEAEMKKLQKSTLTVGTQTDETLPDTDKVVVIRNSKIKNLFQSYTGLTYMAFLSLLSFLVPKENPVKLPRKRRDLKKLSVQDKLLLVLMRLRGGFMVKDLAFRFSLCEQSVSELFSSWIGYMFCELGQLSWWPHRETIISHMPTDYKKSFPRCIAIIDCTELKTEKPSSLKVQSQCYSDYKSSTTLKSLVVVDPKGAVMFVSALFSGSMSDNDICEQSGFYDYLARKIAQGHLIAGDAIMADKGFTIHKELSDMGLGLNIPPFASSAEQMSATDVAFTNLIAAHRIHVERRIGRIKNFNLVAHKIPITLFPIINEIWFVCCFLSNFQNDIVKSS